MADEKAPDATEEDGAVEAGGLRPLLVRIALGAAALGVLAGLVFGLRFYLSRNGGFEEHDAQGRLLVSYELDGGVLHGPRIEWNPDGSKRREVHYEEGRRNGPDLLYWPGGAVQREGAWREDRPEGLWREFHADGSKRTEGEYAGREGNDPARPTGPWVTWSADGTKIAEGRYQKGRQDGPWQRWWENGRLRSQGRFAAGERAGRWTVWYEQGSKESEGIWRSGQREGRWTEWYASGQRRSEGSYRAGEAVGDWKRWHETGALQVDTREYAKDGQTVREVETFFPDGRRRTFERFADGKPDGVHRAWYPDGVLFQEGPWVAGLKDGSWKTWPNDGGEPTVIEWRSGERITPGVPTPAAGSMGHPPVVRMPVEQQDRNKYD